MNDRIRLFRILCLAGAVVLVLATDGLRAKVATTAPDWRTEPACENQAGDLGDGLLPLGAQGGSSGTDSPTGPTGDDPQAGSPTPEPATAAFLAAGSFVLLWTAARRRNRRQ